MSKRQQTTVDTYEPQTAGGSKGAEAFDETPATEPGWGQDVALAGSEQDRPTVSADDLGGGVADELDWTADPASEQTPVADLTEVPDRADDPVWTAQTAASMGPVPWKLGLMLWTSLIMATLGGGAAILLTLGGRLDALLHPTARQLGILLIAVGLVAACGVWAATSITRAAQRSRHRLQVNDELLAAIASIDPCSLEGHDRALLRLHAGITRFLGGIAETYRQKENQLRHYIGLEGEILRLQNSLAGGAREDLVSSGDNPALEKLGRDLLHLFDAEATVRRENAELVRKLADHGIPLRDAIVDAARFNSAALDQVNLQLATFQKLDDGLADLVQQIQGQASLEQQDSLERFRNGVREALPRLQARPAGKTLAATADVFKDLVDRGGTLAIRAATELGKLGQSGNGLLRSIQDLQKLITEFRAATMRIEELAEHQTESAQTVAAACRQLETMLAREIPRPQSEDGRSAWAASLTRLQAAFQEGVDSLGSLAPGFNDQFERLAELGSICARLTGVPVDSKQPAASLSTSATLPREPVRRPGRATPAAPGPRAATLTAEMEPAASLPSPDPVPPVVTARDGESLNVESHDPFRNGGAGSPRPPSGKIAAADSALSNRQERVYDLAEFGAVALDQTDPDTAAADDHIYELSEFGAVALT